MRELFGASLWPEGTRHPHRRMAQGVLVAALIVSLVLTLFRVIVATVTGLRGSDLYQAAMSALENSVYTVFGFTLTLGLIGVAALWALRRRSAVPWAITGGLLAAAAGFAFGATSRVELATYALFGWALFLAIRWQAGVKG